MEEIEDLWENVNVLSDEVNTLKHDLSYSQDNIKKVTECVSNCKDLDHLRKCIKKIEVY